MNSSRLAADDPRLTAYALGELDAAEVKFVEAALRADPALRAEVEQIRACAAQMESALAAEPAPENVTPLRIHPARRSERPRPRWLAFPQLYYLCGALAAAALAVFVAVNREEILEGQRRRAESRPTRPDPSASPTTVVALDLAPKTAAPSADTTSPGREGFVLAPRQGEAAYAALRQHLAGGRLPPAESVHPGELVNAFRYRRPPAPPADAPPIAADLELGSAPWAPERKLVKIGLQGREAEMAETRRAIIEGFTRTQASIAKNVRIQVEFNPAVVAGYRLVGAASDATARVAPVDELAKAPEMFAGQAFTALYEIVPATPPSGAPPRQPSVLDADAAQLLTLRLQYAEPSGGPPQTLEFSLADRAGSAALESADFRMATAAAGFALVLRQPRSDATAPALRAVLDRAVRAAAHLGDDRDGRRAEFVELVRQAQTLLE